MIKATEDKFFFRRMNGADLDVVLTLEAKGHAVPWGLRIFQDCLWAGYYCILLEREKVGHKRVLLAYAIMSAAAGEAHILNVCVNKKYQRQGFGQKIVTHLLGVAKNNKVKMVFLEVRLSNNIAINLYESLGFFEIGHRGSYYPTIEGCREDALVMALELNSSFEVRSES